MKLSEITDKLKKQTYGDQGISPSSANSYIWTSMGTYILDPLVRKMDVNKFRNNTLIYVEEDFDDEVDFPSISYIKDDFEYDYLNKTSLNASLTIPSSKSQTLSILNVEADSDESVGKVLAKAEFASKKSGSWTYMIEVKFPDKVSEDEEREKVITIWPREIQGTDYRDFTYVDNSAQPQFFDIEEEDTLNTVDIHVKLPSLLGDEWTVNISVEDYVVFSSDDSEELTASIMENTIINDTDETYKFTATEFDPELNLETIADYTTITPTFDVFIMEDEDVDNMMAYIVSIYNWTSDEAQTGQEQSAAFQDYNLNLKGYPINSFIKLVPDEFLIDSSDYDRTIWNSGTKIGRKNY